MFYLMAILCLACQSLAENGTLSADDASVKLVSSVVNKLNESEMDAVTIKDFITPYRWHLLPARLHCTKGHIKSLSSLRKSANVNVTRLDATTILTVPMELTQFQYHYKECVFTILKIFSWRGRVTVSSEGNALQAQATIVREKEGCNALVANVQFQDVGSVTVRVNGRLAYRMGPKMGNAFAHYMITEATNTAIEKLEVVIPLVVTNQYLCDNFNN